MQAKQITISKTNDTSSPLLNVNLMDSATEDIKKELSGSKIGLMAIQVSDKNIYESTISLSVLGSAKFSTFIKDFTDPYLHSTPMSMITIFSHKDNQPFSVKTHEDIQVVLGSLPPMCTVILNFWTAPE